MGAKERAALASGPFTADQLRSGDPYELSNGHAILTPPGGQRHGKSQVYGAQTLDSDPEAPGTAIDLGISPRPKELRAPDISVGTIPDAPGWARSAPPLAVEYADVGQDEDDLYLKIDELFQHGTRVIWVVRLAGERCVEIHEPGKKIRVARPGDALEAPGILANSVPVEALYDRDAAHEATLRNLLNRKGFRDLDDVKRRGREEGRTDGRRSALRAALFVLLQARGLTPSSDEAALIEGESDPDQLERWIARAATADAVARIFV